MFHDIFIEAGLKVYYVTLLFMSFIPLRVSDVTEMAIFEILQNGAKVRIPDKVKTRVRIFAPFLIFSITLPVTSKKYISNKKYPTNYNL